MLVHAALEVNLGGRVEGGGKALDRAIDFRQADHFEQLFLTVRKWFAAKGYRVPALHHVTFGAVTSEDGKTTYEEGKDFSKVEDPKFLMDPNPGYFTIGHEQPTVTIPQGSRLKEGDKAGALSLLHRMTMVAGEPFDDLTAATGPIARSRSLTNAWSDVTFTGSGVASADYGDFTATANAIYTGSTSSTFVCGTEGMGVSQDRLTLTSPSVSNGQAGTITFTFTVTDGYQYATGNVPSANGLFSEPTLGTGRQAQPPSSDASAAHSI